MPKRIQSLGSRRKPGAEHSHARLQEDQRRGTSSSRGYNARWRKARETYLKREPLCVCCTANGVPHPANTVDHTEPHKGDTNKFWDTDNWQALCGWCHNNIKSSIERAWEAGEMPSAALSLNRKISGWVHPAARP